MPPQPAHNPFAWSSLGLGVLAFPLFLWAASRSLLGVVASLLMGVAAIVCGVLGRRVARRRNQKGEVLALVGIAAGFILLILFALALYVVSTDAGLF